MPTPPMNMASADMAVARSEQLMHALDRKWREGIDQTIVRTARAPRRFDKARGIGKFGEQQRGHDAPSSSTSLRTSCIDTTGTRRTKTRYISANKPSEPNVVIQSHIVGMNSRHMLTA